MSPIRFFRIALILPIALPLVFLPFGMNVASAVLLLSLVFGGIQYLLFACVMFFLIGRIKDEARIQKLSFCAPLLFIPIQGGGWLLYEYIDQLFNPDIIYSWGELIPFAVYILIIGYVYVGLVNIVYGIVKNGPQQSTIEP
ncbi:MAG: hypothetical protein HZB95_10000 [Nitrosomonadales bacterium]|nr:hypothetical protein [Nitrosomonadales bacterium]